MRLLFLGFTIAYGGSPMGNIHLAKRLLRAGHDVHIIDAYGFSKRYLDAVKAAGLPCCILMPNHKDVYIGGRGLRRFISFITQLPGLLELRSRLVRKVLEINPDVIWVSGPKSFCFLASSFKLRKYPLVMYYRGWGKPEQLGFFNRWVLRMRANAIMTVSMATAEQFRRAGFPPDKLHPVLNTIDFEEVKENARKDVGVLPIDVGKYPHLLLPAGRPVFEKGHLTAVRALARLKAKGINGMLWMPGEPAEGAEPDFAEKLNGLIRELELEENVRFLGWVDNMSAWINVCDIVILPTYTEGFPRVVLEAMLLRKPVITTPVGGICEAIIDGQTGFLFPVGDDETLANKIEDVIKNRCNIAGVLDRAYSLVTTKYTPELHTARVIKVFESVLRN